MSLHLVRHAKAGSRQRWSGDDTDRPLTAKGWEQARGLAKTLADVPLGRVLSSPYARCAQTVTPLAEAHGRQVELTDALREGAPFEGVLALLHDLPDASVLCSHGDVVPDVVEALVRRGTTIEGEPDWRKGARWELVRAETGLITAARAFPPPE